MRRNKLEQLDEKEYIEETEVMFGYLHDVLELCVNSNELVKHFWNFQCDRVGILNYYYEVIDELDRIDIKRLLDGVLEYNKLPKYLIRPVLIRSEHPVDEEIVQLTVRGFEIIEDQYPYSQYIDKELDTALIFNDPFQCSEYLLETFGVYGFDVRFLHRESIR